MDSQLATAREWTVVGVQFLAIIIGWVITWQKLVSKVNGLGGRVKRVEDNCQAQGGRMDRFERELAEYRADARGALERMARVEKGVDDTREEVQQGNIALGSQLHSIERLITDKDTRTQTRLVRLETVNKLERKLGPLGED